MQALAAHKKVLQNPFNASHSVHGSGPEWASRPLPQLQPELKRRGLSHDGTKAELIERIKEHNCWILTNEGKREIYLYKLDLLLKEALENVVPFDLLPKLPTEIRLIIWAYSLPGPRVLNSSDRRVQDLELFFYGKENDHNPAALSVCRESRIVAWKRYSLCFGTNNAYADLPGGDILFFGSTSG